ncbi:MAG TPA: DUF5679 domain-containing protein [Nitrososphaeraceae archaeon]|nr:DUF5679 domain-containing protein [Nitrososphaeraceae archaeon]
MATQAYCVKCKAKRDMEDEKQITMKNGQRALSGTCPVCSTKMFKIGGGRVKTAAAPKAKAGKRKVAKKSSSKAKVKAKPKSKTKKK